MFPFAFGVPLASRQNSPAVTIFPPNTSGNDATTNSETIPSDVLSKETYAEKKAKWRSNLRQPHPFIAEQHHGGYQASRTRSSSLQSDWNNEANKDISSSNHPLITVRYVLTFTVLVLSVAVLIVGLVYANALSAQSDTVLTAEPIRPIAVAPGPTGAQPPIVQPTGVPVDGNELLVRSHPKMLVKRVAQAPGPDSNLANNNANDSTKTLSQILREMRDKNNPTASMIANLFFYVATLPVVSILHACFETVLFFIFNRLSHNQSKSDSSPYIYDDDDSFCDSDAEEINEEKFKHELAYPAPPVSPNHRISKTVQAPKKTLLQRIRPKLPMVSIVLTSILFGLWIILNGIQDHCELTPSGKEAKVCPSRLRADITKEIRGLRAMSIARTTLSWTIVVIYAVQIFITLKLHKGTTVPKTTIPRSGDTETSSRGSPQTNPSPRTQGSILNRNRSRSNSSRRKTVRFDLEEASRRQSERGDDVQYIPAPSEGYDNGYGLPYNYNNAYSVNIPASGNFHTGSDVRTPWQWQGQFEEFVNGNPASKSNAAIATALGPNVANVANVTNGVNVDRKAGSFDFGLASMRRLAQEENAVLAQKTGFVPSDVSGLGFSQAEGLSSHPSVGYLGPRQSTDQQSRNLTTSSGISAVVPFALSTTAVPFKPKRVPVPKPQPSDPNLQRHDTVISAMTNGRRSVDYDTIDPYQHRVVSPLER